NSYGHHAIIAALEKEPPAGSYDVILVPEKSDLSQAIVDAGKVSKRVLVAWSFYSPNFLTAVEELRTAKAQAPGSPQVLHVAGGVHATAEPKATLDAGFDIVAVGEG